MWKWTTRRIATDPVFHAKATEIARAFMRDKPDLTEELLSAEQNAAVINDGLYNAMFTYIRETGQPADFEEATFIIKKLRRLVREGAGLSVDPNSNY